MARETLYFASTGDGHEVPAWVYEYVRPVERSRLVTSGDWRELRGLKRPFLDRLVQAHCGPGEHEVAARLADRGVLNDDVDDAASRILPLAAALERQELCERRLAQATGKWAVLP